MPKLYKIKVDTNYAPSNFVRAVNSALMHQYCLDSSVFTISEDSRFSSWQYGHTFVGVFQESAIATLSACPDLKVLVIEEVRLTNNQFSKEFEELIERGRIKIEGAGDTNNYYNTRCEVHMPGQALSMYNDLMLCSDACTDQLQTHLNQGWRIIAACPQPDQRRPDYILGRYNPNVAVEDFAIRG